MSAYKIYVGQLTEFDVRKGHWSVYCERLDMFFLANKIEDTIKLPTMLTVMGEEAYLLLSKLASPIQPSTLTYYEAISLMRAHLQPKSSVLAERFKFRQRRQLDGESIADYVSALKNLAKNCDFGAVLEDNLRDQLVCGIISEITRQKLFAKDNITYTQTVALAETLEAAEKNQELVCSFCRKLGHLRRMCPEIEGGLGVAGTSSNQSLRENVTDRGAAGAGDGRWEHSDGGAGSGGGPVRGRGRGRARRGRGQSARKKAYSVSDTSVESYEAPPSNDNDKSHRPMTLWPGTKASQCCCKRLKIRLACDTERDKCRPRRNVARRCRPTGEKLRLGHSSSNS